MSIHVLEVYSDVMRIAVASIDVNDEIAEKLTIYFDGGCHSVIHVYVDEAIPKDIIEQFYCHDGSLGISRDLTKSILFESGQLFVCDDSIQQVNKKCDTYISIPKGKYQVTVYPIDSEGMSLDANIINQSKTAIKNEAVALLGEKKYLKAKWLQEKFVYNGCFFFVYGLIALVVVLATFPWMYKFIALAIYVLSIILLYKISGAKIVTTLAGIQYKNNKQFLYDYIIHLESMDD